MDIDYTIRLLMDLIECQTFNWPHKEVHFQKCCDLIDSNFLSLGFNVQRIETLAGPAIWGYHRGVETTPNYHFNGHYDIVPSARNQRNSAMKGSQKGSGSERIGVRSLILAFFAGRDGGR